MKLEVSGEMQIDNAGGFFRGRLSGSMGGALAVSRPHPTVLRTYVTKSVTFFGPRNIAKNGLIECSPFVCGQVSPIRVTRY